VSSREWESEVGENIPLKKLELGGLAARYAGDLQESRDYVISITREERAETVDTKESRGETRRKVALDPICFPIRRTNLNGLGCRKGLEESEGRG